MNVLFEEKQQFRQAWVWALIGGTGIPIVLFLGYGLYRQLVEGKTFGNRPLSNANLIVLVVAVILIELAMLVTFWISRLHVQVTDREIVIRFYPFHLRPRRIELGDLREAARRHYEPLAEYGGWGIRYGFDKGWAYNVSGHEGVQLVLADGKRILIGSQRSAELEKAIAQARTR